MASRILTRAIRSNIQLATSRTPAGLLTSNQTRLLLRSFSNSTRRQHASPLDNKSPSQPLDKHTHLLKSDVAAPDPAKTAFASASSETGKVLDPYKGGPSAIDKAMQLFFFTEILRGR